MYRTMSFFVDNSNQISSSEKTSIGLLNDNNEGYIDARSQGICSFLRKNSTAHGLISKDAELPASL